MTVSSTTTKKSANGDGSNDTFPYDFKIFDDDDIAVVIRTDSTGAEATKTKTTHYTVTGVGSASGGNVVFTSGNIPVSGETVVLLRNTARTQLTDYVANDPFPADSHEDALDKLTLITQELEEEIGRSLKVSQTNIIATSEFTDDATARANKVLGFDGSGDLQVTAGKVDTITSSVSAVSAGGTPTASATYTASSGALALAFGLVTGNTGATGNTGSTGAAGSNAGLALTFSNSTSDADPGGGKLAFNNGTISSATVIFIDDNDDNGVDISTFVQSWDDVSNSTAKGIVLVTKEGTASTYAMFKITGSVTNASGYSKVTVTHVVSNGTFSNDDGITVQFSYSGADASATDLAGGFTASDGCTITTADNTTQLTLTSTDADATEGPRLDLRRNSASPADDDVLGTVRYQGENDASEDITYAEIKAQAKDVTDGTEDSELRFFVRRAGDLKEAMMLGQSSVVFNEGSADMDFRVESDAQTYCFFINGGTSNVGINGAPAHELDVLANDTNGDATIRVLAGTDSASVATMNITTQATAGDRESRLAFGDAANANIGKIAYHHDDNSMRFTTNAAERMRLTANTFTMFNGASAKLLFQRDDTTTIAGNPLGAVEFSHTDSTDAGTAAKILGEGDGSSGEGRMTFYTGTPSALSERMRITSAGKLCIGTTSPFGSSTMLTILPADSNRMVVTRSFDTSAQHHHVFQNNSGTDVGKITVSTTATSYNTSSDYRLKTAVEYDWNATSRLKQLKPARFNFIADADTTVDGFLAHEVQNIVPEAITGTKDAMTDAVLYVEGDEIPDGKNVGDVKTEPQIAPQSIDQSKLTPLLTKALIEAVEKIEALEARIAALEDS